MRKPHRFSTFAFQPYVMERRFSWVSVFALGMLWGASLLIAAEVKGAPPNDLSKRPVSPGLNKEDWPQFLGPRGDGKSAETGLDIEAIRKADKAGKAPLSVLWRRKLGTGYGAPTVSRGRLFHFERVKDKAVIMALHSETGEELWRHEYATDYVDSYGYNNGPRCSVVVDDDRVYAYGVEGMLICLSTVDGKKLWSVNTTEKYGVVQNFFGVGSTPVVFNDLLLVMVGGSGKGAKNYTAAQLDLVQGDGSGIVAFDKMTGKERYAITDELASYASMKLAKVGKQNWGLAFCRGGLVGFDPQKGDVLLQFPWRAESLESVNASMPVVEQGQVLLSETYGPGSVMLDLTPYGNAKKPTEPAIVWKDKSGLRDKKSLQTHWNTPVFHEGYVYGSSGRHTGNAELRCVEWKTGKVMWSEPGLTRMSLTYIDGHFLCLGEYGQLILIKANPEKLEPVTFDLLAGNPKAQIQGGVTLQYPCWAAPVVARGLLYVRGDDELACLELIKGK